MKEEKTKIRVIIRVTRKTEYASVVDMDAEKYDSYQNMLAGKSGRDVRKLAEKEINSLVDIGDWQYDEFDSLEQFQEFKDESHDKKP